MLTSGGSQVASKQSPDRQHQHDEKKSNTDADGCSLEPSILCLVRGFQFRWWFHDPLFAWNLIFSAFDCWSSRNPFLWLKFAFYDQIRIIRYSDTADLSWKSMLLRDRSTVENLLNRVFLTRVIHEDIISAIWITLMPSIPYSPI
jgi:hypothetical protein